jgi:Uncharacterised nucleotidyltransferase
MTGTDQLNELAVQVVHAVARSLGEPGALPVLADERLDRPAVAAETVAAAVYHGVVPLLWAAVEGADAPDALRAAVRDPYLSLIALQLRLDNLAKVADEALTSAAIAYAVYKGPAVARHYPSPTLRGYSDIDVLVSRRDLDRADAALREAGLDGGWAGVPDSYAETAYHRNGMGSLDLHWHVMREEQVRTAFRLDTDMMLSRARRRSSGADLVALDEADELIAVATHACFDGAYRLGWLVDVARLLLAPELDSGELRRRCAQSGTALPVQVILDRAQRAIELPADEVSGRGPWRRSLDWLSTHRPAERTFRQAGRGGLAYRATRSTSARSFAALTQISLREGLLPLVTDRNHRWRTGRNVRI